MENHDVHLYLFHIFGRLSRRFIRPPSPNELTPSEMAVLWTLAHSPVSTELYPSQISHMMGIQRPSLTPLLRSLEAKGLVERQPDLLDGRRCRIALTERCREVQGHMGRQQLARFTRLLDALDPGELEQLSALLHKLEAFDQAASQGQEGAR